MERPPQPATDGSLRRVVSLPWLVLYGLGTTIGAGIYALTGVVAGRAGMHAPIAFLVASLLALFTALSFAELSSRFPRAGGEAVYVLEGFRSLRLSRTVGLLIVLAGLVSAATVSVGMVGYLATLLPVPEAPVVGIVVLAVGLVAAWGVRASVTLAGVMTLVEVGGLVLVTVAAGDRLGDLPERAAEIVRVPPSAWSAVGAAAILCFYAFLGFEDMVSVAEEVEDVRRALPIAILTTLGITTLLYALVVTAAVLTVPPEQLARADAPLSLVFERGGGPPRLLSAIAVIALANGALVQLVKGSRVLYGLACEGALPRRLAVVHPRTGTPLLATTIAVAVTLSFALALPLAELARITSLITLVTFGLANGALIRVKRRGDADLRGTRVPIGVPVAGLVASLGFVAFELSRLVASWHP